MRENRLKGILGVVRSNCVVLIPKLFQGNNRNKSSDWFHVMFFLFSLSSPMQSVFILNMQILTCKSFQISHHISCNRIIFAYGAYLYLIKLKYFE